MITVIRVPFLPTGSLSINSSYGGSVASAKAPRVSMIKFTHKSCTAVRGALPAQGINLHKLKEVTDKHLQESLTDYFFPLHMLQSHP